MLASDQRFPAESEATVYAMILDRARPDFPLFISPDNSGLSHILEGLWVRRFAMQPFAIFEL